MITHNNKSCVFFKNNMHCNLNRKHTVNTIELLTLHAFTKSGACKKIAELYRRNACVWGHFVLPVCTKLAATNAAAKHTRGAQPGPPTGFRLYLYQTTSRLRDRQHSPLLLYVAQQCARTTLRCNLFEFWYFL